MHITVKEVKPTAVCLKCNMCIGVETVRGLKEQLYGLGLKHNEKSVTFSAIVVFR